MHELSLTPEVVSQWGPSIIVALILGTKEGLRRAGSSDKPRHRWVKPTPEQSALKDLATRLGDLEQTIGQEMDGTRLEIRRLADAIREGSKEV